MSARRRPLRRRTSLGTALAAVIILAAGCHPGSVTADHFGVHISRGLAQRFDVAAEIGGGWVRSHPSIIVQDPRPEAGTHRANGMDEIGQWRRRGYEVHVTVRRNGYAKGTGQVPSTPPPGYVAGAGPSQPAFDAYRRELAAILDAAGPEAIAVENEEDAANYWDGRPGTPEEQMRPYVDLVGAAAQVARSRGVKVTNGGLTTLAAAYVTYQRYLDEGRPDQADAYARLLPSINFDTTSATYQTRMRRGRYVATHSRAAGATYINFHWYQLNASAFEQTITALRSVSGLPVVSNEIGRLSDIATEVAPLAQKVVSTGMPWAIWFSLDVNRARALQDDGTDRPRYPAGNLRPRGEALRDFLATR